MSLIVTAIIVIIALYVIKAIRLYRRQGEQVYHPSRELSGTPADRDLDYEDVYFRSADNTLLHGWFAPCTHSHRAILLFHGNTGNISNCITSISIFAELGYSTFVFDYRGYGHSEGQPDEPGTYQDATAAWEWLLRERHYAPQNVVILGRSLGAAIGSWLASQHRAAAVVLESTFTSLPDIAAETHPLVPARLMTRYKYNTLENVRNIHSPIMIVHGRDDAVISYHHGQRLFAAAHEPRVFMDIDSHHAEGFLNSGQDYINGLREFLDKHIRQ
jgi:alpha-beta hydrolase superfamily lysophospholipase